LRGVRKQFWLGAVVTLPGLEQICREANAVLTRVLLRKKLTVLEHWNLERGTGNSKLGDLLLSSPCPLQAKC
jgi:hypothetical protein